MSKPNLEALAQECEQQMWRKDDRLPSVADTYSHARKPPRDAPTPRSQMNTLLKSVAALCRAYDKDRR
jgi:hypothetical protein